MVEINLIDPIASVFASFLMALIVWYYNRKNLKLIVKSMERPKVVDVIRFCIVPLMEWLEELSKNTEPIELNFEELLKTAIERIDSRELIPRLHSRWFFLEFNTILEKLKFKVDWDEKVSKYNEYCRELRSKNEKLEQRLKEIIDNDPEIKASYEREEVKRQYNFEVFLNDLVGNFYRCYRENSLSGAWYYVDSKVFERIKNFVDPLLKEKEELISNKNVTIKALLKILEKILNQLRKEYYLTPSEQKSIIQLGFPLLRF